MKDKPKFLRDFITVGEALDLAEKIHGKECEKSKHDDATFCMTCFRKVLKDEVKIRYTK